VDYDAVYRLESDWRLLPPFTHPEPARCLVTGTGLTHKASADNRQAMHQNPAELSDSMRMYLSGLEGGRPAPGTIGVAPEWFYKGCGTSCARTGIAGGTARSRAMAARNRKSQDCTSLTPRAIRGASECHGE